MKKTIEQVVCETIAAQTGKDNVKPTDRLVADLLFDELDLIEVVMGLEDDLVIPNIFIPDEEMAPAEQPDATVQTIIDILAKVGATVP